MLSKSAMKSPARPSPAKGGAKGGAPKGGAQPKDTFKAVSYNLDEIIATLMKPETRKYYRDGHCTANLTFDNKNSYKKTPMPFKADVAKSIILDVKKQFMKLPSMIQVTSPVSIVGDIHGQFADLLIWLDRIQLPPASKIYFLGDVVDRGKYSCECIFLVFCLLLKYPSNVHMSRGNHESLKMTTSYGFFKEVLLRFDQSVYVELIKCFDCLPLAGLVDNMYFCCHGGIGPTFKTLSQVTALKRPLDIPESGLACDLVWADRDREEGTGFKENIGRGISWTYAADVVTTFLQNNNLKAIIRSHEVEELGWSSFAANRVITIFSAAYYGGSVENDGAIISIKPNAGYTFSILKSSEMKAQHKC